MSRILLTTLNARYIHASLGLRYLLANMAELRPHTRLHEYTISQRAQDIVEEILATSAEIIGFGVYIWNITQTTEVVRILKCLRPEVRIVLGGPEVSYEYEDLEILAYADYLICGNGDLAFRNLCRDILANQPPVEKIIRPATVRLDELAMPYREYTDEDIANRIIYVEASRGCPFKCEFCLSSLDKTAWPFDLDSFLQEMQLLYERGARHFKFVDRTFNLKVSSSWRILEFFHDKPLDDLFLHFELIPDNLPEQLKTLLARFPDHTLQFEIGVQSLNPEVQALISRKQDNERTRENLLWLRANTHAHIHADLIIGLPGEDTQSFAAGFNALVQMQPHEIQVGILKRLKGTPIIRHSNAYAMRYNPYPPYNILSTSLIDFATMQRLTRFARYWDMIANSGRFKHTLPLILADDPFAHFLALSDWLYQSTSQTHKIALPRLFELLYRGLQDCLQLPPQTTENELLQDYAVSGIKGPPRFTNKSAPQQQKQGQAARRQKQHLAS